MNSLATRPNIWLARLGDVSARLVHPGVTEPAAREDHARLIGVLLLAPFFLVTAIAQTLHDDLGSAATIAAASAVFGLSWLAVLIVASTGRDVVAALLALALGAGVIGVAVAGAGGLASPVALIASALVLEALWVYRSRNVAVAGIAAIGAAFGISALFHGQVNGEVGAAQWFLPLAYAGSLALRAGAMVAASRDAVPARDSLGELVLASAVLFEFEKGGDVRRVEGRVGDLFGLAPDYLRGSGLFDRIQVADRVHFLCALVDARAGLAVKPVEVRVRVPGAGAGDHHRSFLAEFRGDGGRVAAIFRDHGDVAGLRRELAEAREAAAQLDVAKSRFLAGVSHELRTPLNAIIGFSDMLLHNVVGPLTEEKQKEYVGLIRQSGNHLLEVVNSILDVSKIESGAYPIHAEPFRFAEAVTMSCSMMALQAEQRSVTIHHRLAPNTGELHADRRAVHQILINLVSNAVKFTPAGGSVTIGSKRLGTRLHFWVSDTGIGISEDDLERLGQPFMQVQNDYTRQFEGTGLGLSLVKGLVALHDGTMSIESAPGEGTTVAISLPLFGPRRRNDKTNISAVKNGEDDAAIRKAG